MSDREYSLVASIDIGTTSSRAILFNRKGHEIAKHQIEYSTTANTTAEGETKIFSAEGITITATEDLEIEDVKAATGPTLRFPNPGWVEVKPAHVLANGIQCLAACIISLEKINAEREAKGEKPFKITSIGIANMRETTIVWDKKTGRSLNYGIVWNDTRTAEIVNKKKASVSAEKLEELRHKCGLPVSTYFSASKLRWLIDNDADVKSLYDKGELMFGTIDTWLIYHMTKENSHVSDVTNASRTMFMDISTFQYDDELLALWDIDPKKVILPKIVSSSEFYGSFCVPELGALGHSGALSETAIEKLNTIKDTPICGCLGDQSASLVGQLALKQGAAKCTYGTGCFLLYNTGKTTLVSTQGALTTVGFWFPALGENENYAHYALEGSIAVAGSVVQWLRDNLKLINSAQDIGPLANQVSNSGGVVFVPAFSGLFAPYWDSEARGTILGLTQYTTASHIARAALEGVCYQARAILKAMATDAGAEGDFLEQSVGTYEKAPLSLLAVDGGMSKSDEVMQIQADILGPCVTVRRSPNAEATALGAAIAAGLAEKDASNRLWNDLDDVVASIGGESQGDFVSQSVDTERRAAWTLWERAIERARGWISN
jgi:glycerol kinase